MNKIVLAFALTVAILFVAAKAFAAPVYYEGTYLNIHGANPRNESCSVTRSLYNHTDEAIEWGLAVDGSEYEGGVIPPNSLKTYNFFVDAEGWELEDHEFIWNNRPENGIFSTFFKEEIPTCTDKTTTTTTTDKTTTTSSTSTTTTVFESSTSTAASSPTSRVTRTTNVVESSPSRPDRLANTGYSIWYTALLGASLLAVGATAVVWSLRVLGRRD